MERAAHEKLGWARQWPHLAAFLADAQDHTTSKVFARYLMDTSLSWLTPNAGKVTISALPILVSKACGGSNQLAEPLAEVWQVIRLALKILDDVEDGDVELNPALVTNAASAFVFVAQLLLTKLAATTAAACSIRDLAQSLNMALFAATSGQHRDLLAASDPTCHMEPDEWLEVAAAKSGEPLGWASAAGAVAACVDDHKLPCWREYGRHLGILLQVADDFAGVWVSDGAGDIARPGASLPVCYARFVMAPADRTHLDSLLVRAADGDLAAASEAKALITATGAQGYLLLVAETEYQAAKEALRQAGAESTADAQPLVDLLDKVLPVLQTLRRCP
jgi:geranylgeranyl diphosphate synthase type I